MHPLGILLIVIGAGVVTFSLVLTLVDFLQKGKKKNTRSLDAGPDESQNSDGAAD